MTEVSSIHTVAEEIVDVVADWLQQSEQKKGKAMDEAINRTPLQIGLHSLLHMRYKKEKL